MKILYFDCSSGISGNMTLGALTEIIGDENYLLNELKKLNIDGYKIEISKKIKNGITGTYVDVILDNEHTLDHHTDLHEHHHEHGHDEHEHHHDHDEHDHCGCHDHDHHHHHHADEVFTSFGRETTHKFTKESIAAALAELENAEKYGQILRAKGIVEAEDGSWINFD